MAASVFGAVVFAVLQRDASTRSQLDRTSSITPPSIAHTPLYTPPELVDEGSDATVESIQQAAAEIGALADQAELHISSISIERSTDELNRLLSSLQASPGQGSINLLDAEDFNEKSLLSFSRSTSSSASSALREVDNSLREIEQSMSQAQQKLSSLN